MTIFETVKSQITVKQAAQHFGMTISRSNLTRCPFHDDHTPSLRLNDDYFYCFGCHASGDVINLCAKLMNLNSLQAAQYLLSAFRLVPTDKPLSERKPPPIRHDLERERHAIRVLERYHALLTDWKVRYAPQSPDDEIDDRYAEACNLIDYVQFLLDRLSLDKRECRAAALAMLGKDRVIEGLERILENHREEVDALGNTKPTASRSKSP